MSFHRNYFKFQDTKGQRDTSDATPSSPATHGSNKKSQNPPKSARLYSVPSKCIVHSMSVKTNRTPSVMLPTTSKSPEFKTKLAHPPIQQTFENHPCTTPPPERVHLTPLPYYGKGVRLFTAK